MPSEPTSKSKSQQPSKPRPPYLDRALKQVGEMFQSGLLKAGSEDPQNREPSAPPKASSK